MNLRTSPSSVAALTFAMALSACTLEKKDDASEFREAIPETNAVSVDGPSSSGDSSSKT